LLAFSLFVFVALFFTFVAQFAIVALVFCFYAFMRFSGVFIVHLNGAWLWSYLK